MIFLPFLKIGLATEKVPKNAKKEVYSWMKKLFALAFF